MAPEQANGEVDKVDARCDVFGLGAILCEILTGRPPYSGASALEVLRKAGHADLAEALARLDACGAAPELVGLAKRSLAAGSADRPLHAGQLAEAMASYRESMGARLRQAELAQAEARARAAEERKRRRLTVGLAASVLLTILVAGGAWLWIAQQRAERERQARELQAELTGEAEEALAQAISLRGQVRAGGDPGKLAQARAEARRAETLLERLPEQAGLGGRVRGLLQKLNEEEADRRLLARLEEVRLLKAEMGPRDTRFDDRPAVAQYEAALRTYGVALGDPPRKVGARIRQRPPDVQARVVAALDDWLILLLKHRKGKEARWLAGVLAQADPDPWRKRLRVARIQAGVLAEADPNPWRERLRGARIQGLRAKLEGLAREPGLAGQPPQTLLMLGEGLRACGAHQQSQVVLRAAQVRYPDDFWINYELARQIWVQNTNPADAVRFFAICAALRPRTPLPHSTLGAALWRAGDLDGAIRACRHALTLKPETMMAHFNLGCALFDKGDTAGALAAWRRGLVLRPRYAGLHYQVGQALRQQGDLAGAVVSYRRVVDLDPDNARGHLNLGVCLQGLGRLDEALASYRRAIHLDPKWAPAHHDLGMCLQARGELDEALAFYRRAIHLDPKLAPAHIGLGLCLRARGRLDEAIAAFRKATEIDPGGGQGHDSLVEALLRRGRFAEARMAAERGLELVPAREPRRPPLREKLQRSEWLLALDARLPALLLGKERPAPPEQLNLARLCRDHGRPHAAAQLYAAAFAARPALADDLGSANRYHAACAAARAGLRRQALAWLRADLALWTRLLQSGKSVGGALVAWQTDPALADVRDPAPLARLPAGERKEWERLWADVKAVLASDPLAQGRAHAARREWAPAADCYARALKLAPAEEGHVAFEHAAVLLLSGDRPGYARACARMVDRCGKAPGLRAYHVARACTLAPGVKDAARAGELARAELTTYAGQFWSLTQRGALLCRAGSFKEAVPLLQQSLKADGKPGRAVLNRLWLALANHQLGKAEEARRWLGTARAWLDQYRDGMPPRAEEEGLDLHNWLEAHVLLREAHALLEATPAAGKR
jgi:serine/threonine-protein kinase